MRARGSPKNPAALTSAERHTVTHRARWRRDLAELGKAGELTDQAVGGRTLGVLQR